MEEKLSPFAQSLIDFFEKESVPNTEQKIAVSAVVSRVVSWYEKFRNAMEYHEEEVIIRASIERILRRRLLLGGSGKTTAESLIRELIWGGYFPDDTVPKSAITNVEQTIDRYLFLRQEILTHHKFRESTLNEWIYQLMSCEIETILAPNHQTEAMGNFAFAIFKKQISITDVSEDVKDVQVYIAVRRAFHRDDDALLRFHLFRQYFGEINDENISSIAEQFRQAYREINGSLNFPRRETIFNYVKKRTPVFLILEDVLKKGGRDASSLIKTKEQLTKEVIEACTIRYTGIKQKVRRAVVRSVLFILCTKVIFAFAVEGTYERIAFGNVLWSSIVINTGAPPLLMIVISFFIRAPGSSNTKRILSNIENILYSEDPRIGSPLSLTIKKPRKKTLLTTVFTILWFFAFLLSFGLIFFALNRLHFNIVSQFVFVFFLTVVSFLSYRISLTSDMYRVLDRQGIGTVATDFLFMPIVRVGRQLAQSVQSINFLLYIFDFVIETPFKAVFAFFEQWFGFLKEKREEME